MTDKIVITPELYEANIPKCCLYQTFDDHSEILMMCWSLANSIKQGKKPNCGFCEFNITVTKQQRDEHYAKLRTFNILKDA